ncbi:hypothetical protein [Campylobacter ureolyticus]|uniref:Sulfate adenylyltransferase n=1 Tax=Campylobacter ureolyticus TaxID=827 RepID=A0AAE7E9I7_9BACT|nr:hypothetical protein [Campylobacter ureolyticus]MCR8684603.1 sulfate adenylyltransferase [Campylobacter ureolyticus]QKF84107.1 sulfate adenylyltransferase [Campylobacter ureolyticus]QQY35747.1 sulfate adenylyltransferase [Campylobacter ureolyticus]SUX24045.1 ATP-sulfurylase family protein [Campylobacter ureolyticus]
MASKNKNKTLKISRETLGTLTLIKNQILSKFDRLMDENEIDEVIQSGYLNKELIPYAYIFAPSGKENQKIAENAEFSQTLFLECDEKIVGRIIVTNNFRYKGYWKFFSIFEADAINPPNDELIESFCISGIIEIYNDKIALIKNKIQNLKKELNLKKVTSLMLCANPFHRVHERLIRLTIDKADFLIIFLLRSTRENRLDHTLRKKTLMYFIDNFLPKDKVLLIDLENTTLFSAHKNPELECIAAYNFGANKIIIGQNHGSIGMFFDDNQAHTIIDKIRKNFDIEILVMPEYVYCNECKTIVSVKTCPHGQHHHIKYHSPTIRTLLLNSVLPPTILMRKEISAIILSDLFPNRFENLQQIYDEIFPNAGILETHTYEDFYKELAKLYQTGSLT